MKNKFLKFELTKVEMNNLKGGVVQNCHCGGTSLIFQVEGTTYEDLEKLQDENVDLLGGLVRL